ncbi:MAG: ATP-binding protein [Defluviitaleaceae bacterium]|nr:ATP-binding protein [Defluviitaleaceae bacterium]MCL2262166.1 ATP-binding protein [Defluviitaleaceae bacterium]
MFGGIRSKSAIPIVGILFLFLAFNISYVARSVQIFSEERSQERFRGATQAARAHLSLIEEYNKMTARALAGDENIIRLINDWNSKTEPVGIREDLFAYLDEIIDAYGISDVLIVDKAGDVILRTHDPEMFGDRGIVASPILVPALDYGRPGSVYVSTDAMPMGLFSAAPFMYDSEIIGVITAILDLSHLGFVDEFGEIFNADVTIFKGEISLASTLYIDRAAGIRAIGTAARYDIVQTVLVEGNTLDTELELFGSYHHAYYFPLLGWEDKPVGMFFIGFSQEDSTAATNMLVLNLIVMNAIGLAIATFIIVEVKKHIDRTEGQAIAFESASKAKSEILSTMSHEIRTPLGAILGISEIQIRTLKPGDAKVAFEKIYTSGGMLLGLINDILDLSKIEAGKMELCTEKYELASLINDTAQLSSLRSGPQVGFEISICENLPTSLCGDELRIKQILNNVLSNAFKYTDHGMVTMAVSQEALNEGYITLVFKISDTGQGMTKEQVKLMFDKFTRFNRPANRNIEGSGLGMNIVKNLLKMMSGKIIVESEPREGSTFTIRIPQKIADATPLGKETVESLSTFQFMGQVNLLQSEWEPMPYGRVLIVDDIDANIYVASGFLEPYMIQVDKASGGYRAIEKIKEGNEYDLILLDQMMPKMDGNETLRRIRELGCTFPIVAYTANALVGQEEDLLRKGFAGFVSKPIQGIHLDAILKKFIRDKQPPEVIAAARAVENHFNAKTQGIDFQELCKDFARSQKDIISELQDALNENDYKTAELLAHTLKGLAGLIGESNLMSLAAKAESAFRKQTAPAALIKSLSTETQTVLASINEKMSPTEISAPKADAPDAKKIMLDLKTQLAEYDAEVINAIPALSQIEGTAPLIEHIQNFDFDSALACVENFLSEE